MHNFAYMEYITYLLVAGLVICSGLFSGLTLGLMGVKPHTLERKAKLGDKDAKRVLVFRKNGNLLLTSLLLGNVLVNAVLSVYLGSVMTGLLAVFLSTALIVLFGEIIPQALLNRHGIWFGARVRPLIATLVFVCYPVAKPISMVLDKALGHELPTIMTKKEIGLIVEEQTGLDESDVSREEGIIVAQTLQFGDRRVRDVMTPMKRTFSVEQNDLLTKKLLHEIEEQGYSRIPVWDDEHKGIVGMLYAKDLVVVSYKDKEHVREVMRQPVEFVHETSKLGKVLRLFKEKRVHLFVVLNDEHRVSGIVTLEDVLEEIFGEIEDEYDDGPKGI